MSSEYVDIFWRLPDLRESKVADWKRGANLFIINLLFVPSAILKCSRLVSISKNTADDLDLLVALLNFSSQKYRIFYYDG